MSAALKRAIFMIMVIVGVGGVLVMAFWPRPVPVDLATIETGDIRVTLDGEGKARVRDVHVVSAPLGGRLARIGLDPGDRVLAEETVLASIEERDPDLLDARTRAQRRAQLAAAEANLALARAERDSAATELDHSRVDLRRTEELHSRGATTDRARDDARLEVRRREAQLAVAEARITGRVADQDNARAALLDPGALVPHGPQCCVPVRSPTGGVVLAVLERGETIVEGGTPLVEIGDPQDIEIVVDLPSEQTIGIEPGTPVIVEDWGGDPALQGSVRRVDPAAYTRISALGIEEQRVDIIIDLETPADMRRRLGHGYRVLARIVTENPPEGPLVPSAALFRDGDRWAVFTVRDGRARLRTVDIGPQDGRHAVIEAGLELGDRVVLHPSDRVVDGVRVAPRDW